VAASGKIKELITEELKDLPDWAKEEFGSGGNAQIWEPVGCSRCGESGYSGRVGIFEILEMTKELGDIVISEPTEKRVLAEAKNQGMITMRQDGILKALKGVTSIEEVVRSTSEE